MGSAISLLSCEGDKSAADEEQTDEALVTRRVDSMRIVSSENGRLLNSMSAPLMEDHAFARPPFQEYRQGIEFVGYNDSTGVESSRVVADYALYWSDRDRWELKGNVLVTGEQNRRLYTQQLTWDRKIHKIYSNVDSKVEEGTDVFIGEGFEAEDDFSRWTFRRLTGTVSVDTAPTQPAESEPGTEPVSDSESQPAEPTLTQPAVQ